MCVRDQMPFQYRGVPSTSQYDYIPYMYVGQVVPVPAKGAVCVGRGMVCQIHTPGIPLDSPIHSRGPSLKAPSWVVRGCESGIDHEGS